MNTNQQDLWRELNLTDDVILWSMYHLGRTSLSDLEELPSWSTAKHIFLIDQEVRNVSAIKQSDPRIHLWDSTVSSNPRIHTYLFWFDWVNEINQHLKLDSKLISIKDKSPNYIFDALLGVERAHRNFVRQKVNRLPNKNKILLSGDNCSVNWNTKPTTWISGGSFDLGEWRPAYNGMQTANISCFLPYEIYNDSWYSIVTETYDNGPDVFYTEKTAKPLLAKRLFVLFGVAGQLEKLRSLGYKTFSSVIDESYDSIQDPNARWSAAWQQVLRLMDMDPLEVYSKLEPVVDHNYNLFVSTNWHNSMKQEIKNLLTTT